MLPHRIRGVKQRYQVYDIFIYRAKPLIHRGPLRGGVAHQSRSGQASFHAASNRHEIMTISNNQLRLKTVKGEINGCASSLGEYNEFSFLGNA
jgi:hypothetical protein